MNPLDTLASVCSDIDPFADLTWMIDRLHSNAARSRLVATKSSGPFPDPQPPVALSQWSQPCATPSGINAACRLNDLVNNDVELRWKCTKPRSGLDKAASTKSNISSYGTVVSVQGALNWFASGTEAGCPPFTTANRPRGHDESPSIGEGLPPKRRRRGTVAQGQAHLDLHEACHQSAATLDGVTWGVP
eukprot:jgi/Ulvmu1/7840/UM004_0070.1